MRKLLPLILLAALTSNVFGQSITPSSGGGGGVGSGTVTTISVTPANGVSATVTNPTTTPALALTLEAITPTSINSSVIGATTPAAGTFTTLTATGGVSFTGLSTGTQVSCLGLNSGNSIVLVASACGSGGGSSTITAGTTATSGVTSGDLIGSASNLVTDSGVPYSNFPITSTVSGDIAKFSNTTGAFADSGVLITSLAPKASPTFTGTVTLPDSSTFGTNFAVAGNAIVTAPSAAVLQIGAANSGTPVAQKVDFQSGSGTNIAGVNATILGSLGTGSSASGNLIFQVGGAVAGSGTTAATATSALSLNGGVASPVVQVVQVGTAALPSLAIGNATTGLYSVSTTGFGISVNGTNQFDYGITSLNNFTIPTGALTLSAGASSVQVGQSGSFKFSSRGLITSPAVGDLQFGAADAVSPVPQTTQAQSVVAGNANTAAVTWTHQGSLSNGSGGGGNMVFSTTQSTASSGVQNTALAGLTILGGTQLVEINQITSDAGLTDATVCEDTTLHGLHSGSGTLGICLGTSGRQFKTIDGPISAGLDDLMKIKLYDYHYRAGFGDNGKRMQYGAMAQDVEAVLPILAGHNDKGDTINYDAGALLFIAMHAIQEQQVEIESLKHR